MSIIQIYFSLLSPLNMNVNFNLKLSYAQNFPSGLCFNHHPGLFFTCQTSSVSKVICFTTSLEMKWDVWFCLIKFHALLPPSYGLCANWSILDEDFLIYRKRINGMESMLNVQNNTWIFLSLALKYSYIWPSLTVTVENMDEKEDTPIKGIQENIWPQSVAKYKNIVQH